MTTTRSILLAYASRYGSTEEVAESITTSLRAKRYTVDMRSVREVSTLDAYDAVVLGAAIYNARWNPDALTFLAHHQGELRQRPVAIFSLGAVSGDKQAVARARGQLDKELAAYPWLQPAALALFVGKYDPSKLGFFARLFGKASDLRDWEAIRAWADALPALL